MIKARLILYISIYQVIEVACMFVKFCGMKSAECHKIDWYNRLLNIGPVYLWQLLVVNELSRYSDYFKFDNKG